MKRRTRICYTEAQKALMWDRWQKGIPYDEAKYLKALERRGSPLMVKKTA